MFCNAFAHMQHSHTLALVPHLSASPIYHFLHIVYRDKRILFQHDNFITVYHQIPTRAQHIAKEPAQICFFSGRFGKFLPPARNAGNMIIVKNLNLWRGRKFPPPKKKFAPPKFLPPLKMLQFK